MKKKFVLSVAFALLLSVLSVSGNESENGSIYVTTQRSEEADEYASKQVYELVELAHENSLQELETIKLGNGILVENPENEAVLETFFYPVFVNDEFKYVLRVVDYKADGYAGYLGVMGVDEIKSLGKISNQNDPVSLYQSNGNLAYYSSSNKGVLSREPIADNNEPYEDTLNTLKRKRSNKITIDANEISDLVVEKPDDSKKIEPRVWKYLTIDYLEKQGNNNWCSGYVNANVARFFTYNTTIKAKDFATYAGVSTTSPIPLDKIKLWWQSKGYNFNYANGTVHINTVISDISSRKPVFGGYQYYKNSQWNYHAILIHGYEGNSVRVWNPWYTKSESANGANHTYTTIDGLTMTMYMYGRYSKR